jgi:hypothetical protein
VRERTTDCKRRGTSSPRRKRKKNPVEEGSWGKTQCSGSEEQTGDGEEV